MSGAIGGWNPPTNCQDLLRRFLAFYLAIEGTTYTDVDTLRLYGDFSEEEIAWLHATGSAMEYGL